jgi:hypothetical protein
MRNTLNIFNAADKVMNNRLFWHTMLEELNSLDTSTLWVTYQKEEDLFYV